MSCTEVLHMMGERSVPQPVMNPVDLTVHLCLSQSPPLCQLLGVSPSLKPLRPCIQPPSPVGSPGRACPVPPPSDWSLSQTGISGDGTSTKKKRVVFADSKGLSLTAVRVFSEREEPPAPERSPNLRLLRRPAGRGRRRLKLGFDQPSADFKSFRARLEEGLVLLESCSVTERSLSGTVRVKNVSYEKAVHVRVTFDSWRSHRDVPCTFLQQRYGGPDTDVFAFDIPVPDKLDPQERLEFCLSYLPGGHGTPLWDNNKGQNYRVIVCAESEAASSRAASSCRPSVPKSPFRGLWAAQSQSKRYHLDNPVYHSTPQSCEILVSQSWGRLENIAPFW
ncbi:hypothetical protein MATL_G00058840 [Megalops atlanticus]|uniref:Protein phosphatase 1 regulatory subunit n=1 Tax=Megalops atlanticus TaxID=7932 RepID=A0A9D3QA68_MEGAT|nr:hypothetical protein MATL_G00058840 [Megalops atlanticus]